MDAPSTSLGKRGLPKFRDILRRAPTDSEVDDAPDLEFVYADSDQYAAEMAELYSYTEESEFIHNQLAFEEALGEQCKWTVLNDTQRKTRIMRLLDLVDVSDREKRMSAVCAILYIAQGTFGELTTIDDQIRWSKHNCFLLYSCGVFATFVEFLSMEFENCVAASAAMRKPAVSMADSTDIRAIINVLYSILETLRWPNDTDTDEQKRCRESLRQELVQPSAGGQDSLCILLFAMVTKFCGNTAPHFPMKKVLLLLWKVCLMSLGGLSQFHQMKNAARAAANLPPLTEDTHEVCRNMRASSPPASAADLLEHQQQQPHRPTRGSRKGLSKQSSMDDPFGENNHDEDMNENGEGGKGGGSDDELPPTPPRPATPTLPGSRCLPWTPKVRPKDLEVFLDHIRAKFVGFQAKNDCNSLIGLPLPIHEGVKVLKQHLYISLSEVQIQKEEELAKNPVSIGEEIVAETPAEILYRSMLPSLPQYMIALLKILLAAAPTSKAKSDSINILADILPEEMPNTVLQSMKLGIDVNRHKEIIVKAIAALLILLLKMFKLNHMYQFEYMSQHLVFANCIPLVLKFFNQNISAYVTAKNSINMLDFPACVIGRQPELTAENLEAGDSQTYCWRNLFSCINLLRILNKLTKWKHSRTMMLVVFKSAPILKRALKVRQAMMQLYILKLIKMQTKYLGRQWRKSNMKTMSAIYQKVRHRLTDDWAYGNDMDARPWDFQAEECSLRASVDRFNNRRYGGNGLDPELQPVDNCILSVLGQRVELSEDFKKNYEVWLDTEVYSNHIDWDRILTH